MSATLSSTALRVPAGQRLKRTPAFQSASSKRLHVVSANQAPVEQDLTRRKTLKCLGLFAMSVSLPKQVLAAGKSAEVRSYLPAGATEGFSSYKPDKSKTPALRSGVINANDSYKFEVPSSYREVGVANIQSGNFCMPNCAEPWTEIVFADDKEGKVQLLAVPLQKLTPKANASIADVGTIDSLVQSFGPYITGTQLEDEDVLAKDVKNIDGRVYYQYESYAPYGTNGTHQISRVTTKGKVAYLFVSSASDKQWSKGEKHLRQALETFRI